MKKKTHDFPEEYGFCAVGAMYAAKYGEDSEPRADRIPAEERAIFEEANGLVHIEGWNDLSSTKKEDVIAAFNKAIELAREKSE